MEAAALDDLARMAHQELEQLELAAREVEHALAAVGAAPARIEPQVADLERLALDGGLAAQQRLHARDHLLHREGLDDVVVGPGLQPADALVDLVARGEHADGHLVAALAQAAQDLEAVEVGHVQVEQHDGGANPRGRLQRGAATRGGHDAEALELEAGGDGAADGGVVVDEQHYGPGWAVIHAGRPRSRGRRCPARRR